MANPDVPKKKSKRNRSKLGRGLSALVDTSPKPVEVQPHEPTAKDTLTPLTQSTPQGTDQPETGQTQHNTQIEIANILTNPNQPRKIFEEESIEQLAESIRTHGVIQPIAVRVTHHQGDSDSPTFELISGERRLRASKLAQLTHIPAIILDVDHKQSARLALIENIQREDLNPIERAMGFQTLIEEFGQTQEQVAQQVGLKRPSVANLLRLLDLDPSIQAMLAKNTLSTGHGKALLGVQDHELRAKLAETCIKEGWSVRALEQAVERSNKTLPVTETSQIQDDNDESQSRLSSIIQGLEKQLSEQLSTNVKLKTNKNGTKGSITIEFYTLDHFDGLMDRLGVQASDD